MKEMLFVSALLLVGLLPGQRRESQPQVVRSGGWRVEINYCAVSHPRSHVTTWEQRALRFAPGDKQGKLIYREASTGRLAVFLRDDGLCFVDPVGEQPLLVFANGQRLPYPLEASEPTLAANYTDLNCNGGGRVHFLGSLCVVVRHVNNLMQVASFAVDMQKRIATPLKKILEVGDAIAASSKAAKAAMPDRLMLRIGDLLLWVNQGAHHMQFAETKDPWRRRELRVFDLKTNAFVEVGSLEYAVLDRHREAVLSFIEEQSHNVVPEFELWAIERFGAWGFRNYMDRMMALLVSCKSAYFQDPQSGARVSGRRRLRKVYLEALLKLNDR